MLITMLKNATGLFIFPFKKVAKLAFRPNLHNLDGF